VISGLWCVVQFLSDRPKKNILNAASLFYVDEHSEQAWAHSTNQTRGVPSCRDLSLLQKPLHNERRRGQWPGHHDQLPATHNERCFGQRHEPISKISYVPIHHKRPAFAFFCAFLRRQQSEKHFVISFGIHASALPVFTVSRTQLPQGASYISQLLPAFFYPACSSPPGCFFTPLLCSGFSSKQKDHTGARPSVRV
jgi:hypothetical protein